MYKKYTQKRGVRNSHVRKLLIMTKLTASILLFGMLQISVASVAQKISLSEKNTSLAKVFKKISQQSGYGFMVEGSLLRFAKPVTINVANAELEKVLSEIFIGQPLKFTLAEQSVIVSKKEDLPSLVNIVLSHKIANAVTQQPGVISGKIVDDKGGPLPGANIKLIELNRAVTSSVDGTYQFSGVPPGAYTIEVSYISFQTKRISDVIVKDGQLAKLDIVLQMSTSSLNEVVVKSSFKKEAIAGLYAQQKNAAGITDGISAEQIARTPDNNMGQVLKRVSGVSTVDNRYVVVRGLTERYNQGMIDGIVLPSTDMNRRNFSFDVIPAEMVSNVVVNKTATPDVSAEFAGGQVSINTLDIPLTNFVTIAAGTGFSDNTLDKTFIQAGKRGKYDFLGFDDGGRKLPAGIQSWGTGPIPDYAVTQSKLFSPDAFKLQRSKGGLNQNYRLSVGRVYQLKDDQKLGFIGGISLRNNQETNEFTDVRGMDYYKNYPKPRVALIDTVFGRRNGEIYKYNTTLGAQLNMGLQGKNYKIGFKNLFSQIFNNKFYTSEGSISKPDVLNETRTKRNLQDPELTGVLQHKIEGEHNLSAGGLKLTWMGTYTTVKQESKDRIKFTYRLTGVENGVEYFQSPVVTVPGENDPDFDYRLFTSTREKNYNWAANLSQPFNFLGDKSLIKIGYNGTFKKRSLDATKLKIFTQDAKFDNFDRPYEEIMAPENMGTGLNQAFYFADGNNGQQFDGKSKFHAGYVMLDQRFLKKLRLVYGIRAEKYDLNNRQLNDKTNVKPTGEKNTVFLLSVNFTYAVTPAMNLRLSFAKTIIRPDFRETSVFSFYDPYLNANIEGADVKSTKIENFDVRYEWYPSAGEIISVSGFYKKFDKPIELVAGTDGFQSKIYRFQNQKDAVNYGLEVELRKSLGFIADQQWLRNLSLFGNGALIKSKINTLSYIQDTTILENKEKRALYGQSPYVVNGGITYAQTNYGLTLSYNRSGRRTYTINSQPYLTEYENGRDQVDLQLFCRLMKQKLELKMNIGNLLNTEAFYYINGNGYTDNEYPSNHAKHVYLPYIGTDKYEKEFDDVRYRIKYGVNYNLTLTYKF